ncbi:MAG: inorganic phosphate transporter [Candidatus Odinarchaeota archaeon]|nr:inorganic phosphate transporter [Candidatus Odinarchaeota archaeon]
MLLSLFIILALSFYIAWSIGTNDETMAAPVGCGVLKINLALILGGILAILGAFVMGVNVSETIGEKLWTYNASDLEISIILLTMAIWLTIASYRELPVSTTHSIIGTIFGIALVRGGLQYLNFDTLFFIIAGWVLSPILGFVIAYVVEKGVHIAFVSKLKGLTDIEHFEKLSSYILVVAVMFTAFSRGANDVANAVGILSKLYTIEFQYMLLWGGIGMAIGLLTLGRRVVKNVGVGITQMRPSSAMSAQISTMLVMFFGTYLGFPLSGTQILVAAIIGVGAASKQKISRKAVKEIVISWIITFPISAVLGICLLSIISFFI